MGRRMVPTKKNASFRRALAVSGGADSVYLYLRWGKEDQDGKEVSEITNELVLLHMNHGARGKESDEDQRFVEDLARRDGVRLHLGSMARRRGSKAEAAEFEARARRSRYAFFRRVRAKLGIDEILVGHTADDQVETILMRFFKGTGIAGLKGIPRKTADGISRPLLDTWREEILEYLRGHGVSFREDASNADTSFERNWIRHRLVPLLEERYGKSVRKRIHAVGERFREVDEFLEWYARDWIGRHTFPLATNHRLRGRGTAGRAIGRGDRSPGAEVGECAHVLRRRPYRMVPPAGRIRIIQILCQEGLGISPGQRLLEGIDRVLISKDPSAELDLGMGTRLLCRYDDVVFAPRRGGRGWRTAAAESSGQVVCRVTEEGVPRKRLRALTAGERAAVFDAHGIALPLLVRPVKPGDRIRPFGLDVEKKVKEIFIEKKIPREERWGRPAVCVSDGEIVWIPGVVRSAHAPVTRETRRTIVLGMRKPSTT